MLFPIGEIAEETNSKVGTMDAVEDRELKLQRASCDLVAEFSAKLPSLLWRAQNGTPLRTPRKWAQVSKTERLVNLVRLWPRHLGAFIHRRNQISRLINATA